MKTRLPRLAGAVMAGTLTLGAASPALAQEAPEAAPADTERHGDPDAVRQRCDRAIERRLGDLATASQRLDEVRVLTDDHAAALDAIIDGTVSGLTALRADIAAAPDLPTTLRLCHTIAPGYRVYLVVLPQAHLTVGADRVDAVGDGFDELVERFDEAVERAEDAGADVGEAVALMDMAEAHVDAAEDAAAGVTDSVLAVTPASFNEGPGRVTLDEAREALRTSQSELRGAHEDGRAAVQALRDAVAAVAASE